jgi:hypothetical protein
MLAARAHDHDYLPGNIGCPGQEPKPVLSCETTSMFLSLIARRCWQFVGTAWAREGCATSGELDPPNPRLNSYSTRHTLSPVAGRTFCVGLRPGQIGQCPGDRKRYEVADYPSVTTTVGTKTSKPDVPLCDHGI